MSDTATSKKIRLRITTSHRGVTKIAEFDSDTIHIGRSHESSQPDLDLTPDYNVSRKHARIFYEQGQYYVEDLGSKFGTRLNGELLQREEKKAVLHGATINIGDSVMDIEVLEDEMITLPDSPSSKVKIEESIDAAQVSLLLERTPSPHLTNQFAILLELPLLFGAQTKIESLLELIVQKAVSAIPGAKRGALLLSSGDNQDLLLRAYVSEDAPAVSQTLARRSIEDRRGFIWRRGFEGELGRSMVRHQIASGMYTPLFWKEKVLGVICVDNPFTDQAFSDSDLRFLISMAHYAGLAVANHQLQESTRQHAKLLERLLTNFSPKIREQLVSKAHEGKLRPGGEKSEITILFSDIRGFTKQSAIMDAGDVVNMLNEYLSAQAEAIFRFDGTVDKFIGDAVLAVFGSPEKDPMQHANAVQAALAMQQAMNRVNELRKARGEVICEIGIGVHCGTAFHGFVGAAERLEFTIIGDAVNRASRYCHAAKAGEVLISSDVYGRVFNKIEAEKRMIPTKEKVDLPAYRVKQWIG